jgi:predicted secreted protein
MGTSNLVPKGTLLFVIIRGSLIRDLLIPRIKDQGGGTMCAIHIRKIYTWAMTLCVALFCSCSVKPAITVTDPDSGSRVEIKRGEILAVKLATQLGTGYGWKVVSESKALVLKGEPEQISKGEQKPGVSEYQTFTFKAEEKGEAVLKLQYIEAWKKDAKPLKEYTITVIIR